MAALVERPDRRASALVASKKPPAKKDPAPAKSAKGKSASTNPAPTKSGAAAKPAAKPAGKPASNPPVKPSAKSSTKPSTKPPTKPSPKPAARAVAAVSKAGTKKVSMKPDPKPAPKVAAEAKAASKAPAAPAKGTPKSTGKAPAIVPAKSSAAAPAKVAKIDAKTDAKPPVKGQAAPAAGAKSPAKSPAKPVGKSDAKGGKGKTDENETPIVPKKGPIDLAQHKSVAEAAAAVANARGGTGEFIIINGRRVRAISTKGISVAKKTKTTATEVAAGPSEQQIREIKTKLGKKELDEYRLLLHAKRRQLVGMLSGMEDEALRSSGGNLSNMPVHMADMGSDVYEQDFTLGMAETERAIITEIDAALQRIEDKTFGVCQMTGKPISKARLDAKPWAKYTIEAERIAESSGPR